MGTKKKAAIQLLILVSIAGLIVWHAVSWHSTGMYLEMFNRLQTGRGYLAVLYNPGLMLVMGAIIGLLMGKVTDLFRYEVRKIKHFDDDAERGEKV